ncbi:MAG: OS_HP3 family (seleno)protein, partial [Desulfatiglandaceae bacterium]
KSIPGPPQTYTGFLKIKTNYPEKPEITVRIRGRIGKKG